MTSWHSYPKVWNVGHPNIEELFQEDVIVEEKVDGSQFSFGRFGDELKVRSKGQELIPDAPEKMFAEAVDMVRGVFDRLTDGWTYRAEYLKTPKHNTLAYARIPLKHLIIFDVNTGEESYLDYDAKAREAERIGFEYVPLLHRGRVGSASELFGFLDRESVLGGQKIEGVVCKNYTRFGRDKKAMMGKHVREDFKEANSKEFRKSNPKNNDLIEIVRAFSNSPARWNKAIQRMRDEGRLENSPKDIGILMKEIQTDTEIELEGEIKEMLWKWAKPHVTRSAAAGFPEFYKDRLVESQFENAAQ